MTGTSKQVAYATQLRTKAERDVIAFERSMGGQWATEITRRFGVLVETKTDATWWIENYDRLCRDINRSFRTRGEIDGTYHVGRAEFDPTWTPDAY